MKKSPVLFIIVVLCLLMATTIFGSQQQAIAVEGHLSATSNTTDNTTVPPPALLPQPVSPFYIWPIFVFPTLITVAIVTVVIGRGSNMLKAILTAIFTILGLFSFSYIFALGVLFISEFFGVGWESITYMVISFPIGAIIGIILVNKLLHHPGSLLLGIVGCILGGVTTYVLMAYIFKEEFTALKTGSAIVTFAVFPLAAALFGTLGFYVGLSRVATKNHSTKSQSLRD